MGIPVENPSLNPIAFFELADALRVPLPATASTPATDDKSYSPPVDVVRRIVENAKDGDWKQAGTGAADRTSDDKLSEIAVSPDDFGAVVGASQAVTKAALQAAADSGNAIGAQMHLSGRTYDIGDSSGLNLGGIIINADPGAILQGDYQLPKKNYRLARPLTFKRTETGLTFLPYDQSTLNRQLISEKQVFYGEGDIDRARSVPVDGTSMLQQEFVYASPSGWGDISSYADADSVVFSLATDRLQAAFSPLHGGDELHTIFKYGDYRRHAVARTVNGFYHLYMDGFDGSGSAGALYWQPYGGSPSLITSVDWQGRTDVEHWYPGYAAWSVAKFSPTQFGFRINGMLLFGDAFTVNSGDLLTDAGFGVSGPSATGGIDWVALQRGGKVSGRGYVAIVALGDSKIAPNFSDCPSFIKVRLEGALGISVLEIRNLGVDGWTTETTYNTLVANGLTGATHVCLAVSTNDAQNSIPLATTREFYLKIIDYCQSRNVPVICEMPGDYYTQASAGQGSITYQNALLPKYRTMVRKLAAMRGCPIFDTSQDMKPVLPYEAQLSPGDPRFAGTYITGYKDNIHPTDYLNNLRADNFVRAFLSLVPARTRAFDEMNLPAGMLGSGWTQGGTTGRISMSAGGRIHLAGPLYSGAQDAGATIIPVPPTFRSFQTRRFKCFSGNNSAIRVDVEPTAIKLVDSFSGSDGYLNLDGITWQAV